MKHEQKFYWLDLFRGLSALIVFFGHLRIICIKDIPFDQLSMFGKVFFLLTGFAHQAVMVFFVLSGFFIIKSIHESYQQSRWSFRDYAVNRLSRLWIVLIPALIFGFAFDKIGLAYFSDSMGYSNQIRYFMDLNVASKLQPEIFAGNIVFLQTILVPTFGSNGPLWSLANEFWYYVLFPLLYFAVVTRYNLIIRLFLLLLTVGVFFLVGESVALYFIIWLMGGLSYILFRNQGFGVLKSKPMLAVLGIAFVGILMCTRLKVMPYIFNDYSLGLVFALMVPGLTKLQMNAGWIKKPSIYLSNISYTLYCTHLPLIFFVTAAVSFQMKAITPINIAIFLGLGIALILYANLMWWLFERNTPKLKRAMQQVVGKSKPAVKPAIVKE